MTLATAQRLYKHYMETGQVERAEDVAQHRPEVRSAKEEKAAKKK